VKSFVEHIRVEPRYRREDGLVAIGIDEFPLPDEFEVRDSALIHIPPGVVGGNHRHPRVELFLTTNVALQLHWVDLENDVTHVEAMTTSDEIWLWVVPSLVPHAIVNTGDEPAMLYELANALQHDVEAYPVVANDVANDRATANQPE
jgi:hypothetical protein